MGNLTGTKLSGGKIFSRRDKPTLPRLNTFSHIKIFLFYPWIWWNNPLFFVINYVSEKLKTHNIIEIKTYIDDDLLQWREHRQGEKNKRKDGEGALQDG